MGLGPAVAASSSHQKAVLSPFLSQCEVGIQPGVALKWEGLGPRTALWRGSSVMLGPQRCEGELKLGTTAAFAVFSLTHRHATFSLGMTSSPSISPLKIQVKGSLQATAGINCEGEAQVHCLHQGQWQNSLWLPYSHRVCLMKDSRSL